MPKRKTLKRRNAKRRSMKKKLLMGGGKGYTKYTLLDEFNSEMIYKKNKDNIYLFFDKTIYSIVSAGFGGILNKEKILKDENGKIFEENLDNIIANTLNDLKIEINNKREEHNQLLDSDYYEIQGLSFGIGIFVNNKELYNEKITNPKDYIIIKASIKDLRQLKLYPDLPEKQNIPYDEYYNVNFRNNEYYADEKISRIKSVPFVEKPEQRTDRNVLPQVDTKGSLGSQIKAETGQNPVHK
jgi:hypothetical protein